MPLAGAVWLGVGGLRCCDVPARRSVSGPPSPCHAAPPARAPPPGVLVSTFKLITFHGCFTWITFRAMGLPLTYTASVASAVCALLPFVPTPAVALPGCVVLLAQGRLLAALAFFGLHFMGYYLGDTAILEVRLLHSAGGGCGAWVYCARSRDPRERQGCLPDACPMGTPTAANAQPPTQPMRLRRHVPCRTSLAGTHTC